MGRGVGREQALSLKVSEKGLQSRDLASDGRLGQPRLVQPDQPGAQQKLIHRPRVGEASLLYESAELGQVGAIASFGRSRRECGQKALDKFLVRTAHLPYPSPEKNQSSTTTEPD